MLPKAKTVYFHVDVNSAFLSWTAIQHLANGETLDALWSCEALPDPMCFGSLAAGEKGVLFGNCASQTARVNATVRYSTDAGAHWDTLWQVDEVAGYIDIAYANRRVYALYELSLIHI